MTGFRKYIKLGALALLILALGYLLGSGSIGNLLRFGDEATLRMAEQAEADRMRAETEQIKAENDRSVEEAHRQILEGTESE